MQLPACRFRGSRPNLPDPILCQLTARVSISQLAAPDHIPRRDVCPLRRHALEVVLETGTTSTPGPTFRPPCLPQLTLRPGSQPSSATGGTTTASGDAMPSRCGIPPFAEPDRRAHEFNPSAATKCRSCRPSPGPLSAGCGGLSPSRSRSRRPRDPPETIPATGSSHPGIEASH